MKYLITGDIHGNVNVLINRLGDYNPEETANTTEVPETNTTNEVEGEATAEPVKEYHVTIILGKDFDV